MTTSLLSDTSSFDAYNVTKDCVVEWLSSPLLSPKIVGSNLTTSLLLPTHLFPKFHPKHPLENLQPPQHPLEQLRYHGRKRQSHARGSAQMWGKLFPKSMEVNLTLIFVGYDYSNLKANYLNLKQKDWLGSLHNNVPPLLLYPPRSANSTQSLLK